MGVCAAATILASPAAAHGPPAAVTGIAASDDAGIRVATFTEGLGIRLDSGWRWICPGAFGIELSPPALSLDGKRTYVVGENDLFVLESDGGVLPQSRPDLSRQSVVKLIAVGGRFYVLRLLTGGASDIVTFDGKDATSIWHDTVSYDSLTADGDSFWVARVDGPTGYAIRLAVDGTVEDSRTFSVDLGDQVVQVLRIGGSVYVTAVTAASGGQLLRLDDGDAGGHALLLSSTTPIAGPISSGSSAWAMSNAALLELTPDAATLVSTDYPVTCVGDFGDAAYLCAQTRLLALGSAGPGKEIFNLNALTGPQPEPAFTDAAATGSANGYPIAQCSGQWDVFRYDLGRSGVIVPEDDLDGGSPATPPTSSSSACTLARGLDEPVSPATGVAGAFVVYSAMRRRYSRRRRSPL